MWSTAYVCVFICGFLSPCVCVCASLSVCEYILWFLQGLSLCLCTSHLYSRPCLRALYPCSNLCTHSETHTHTHTHTHHRICVQISCLTEDSTSWQWDWIKPVILWPACFIQIVVSMVCFKHLIGVFAWTCVASRCVFLIAMCFCSLFRQMWRKLAEKRTSSLASSCSSGSFFLPAWLWSSSGSKGPTRTWWGPVCLSVCLSLSVSV